MGNNGTTIGANNAVWGTNYMGWTGSPSTSATNSQNNDYKRPLTMKEIAYLKSLGFKEKDFDNFMVRSALNTMPKSFDPTKIESATPVQNVDKPSEVKTQPAPKKPVQPAKKQEASFWDKAGMAIGGIGLIAVGGLVTYFTGGLGSTAAVPMIGKGVALLGGVMFLSSCNQQELFDDYEFIHEGSHDLEVNLEVHDIPSKEIWVTKYDTIYQDRVVTDTLYLPGETVTDTIFQDRVVTDTLYLPGETITVRDTLYLPGETVRDTIFEDRVIHDTTYIDRPIYIEVPGETILVPDTLRPEPDPYIDDFTNIVLRQGNDTTGVTVRLTGDKEYEQILSDAILDVHETTNKKMVFKNFNIAYEDDENPNKYYNKAEVSVGTLEDGRKGLFVSLIPAWAGTNYKTYYSGIEQDWNRGLARNLMIVKSADGTQLEKYIQGKDGKFTFAGTISSKEKTVLKDKNLLPESGQSWEQKIKSFETQSAYVTKKPGESWK